MLAKRIIACLDIRDGSVVKGVRFQDLRDAGAPAALARRYNREGIDELVILDVTATLESRRAVTHIVREVARELFIPLAVGGGIRSLADAEAMFDAGADKVSVNSAALERPGLISEIAARFGSQAVVVAIDARRSARQKPRATPVGDPRATPGGEPRATPVGDPRATPVGDPRATPGGEPRATESGEVGATPAYQVFARSGQQPTGRDAVEWAREAEARGAGEILLTSMDRDGTRAGFECQLTAAVSDAVSIPVIASGGAGRPEDFLEVFLRGRADAALAASVFHYQESAVAGLKRYLAENRIPVRI